ncbi:MAG: hypothetical protein ACFCU2_08905 [Acidimicrobiia bacterium]
MGGLGVQISLVIVLLLINGVLAGTEIALISLRESQIARLEAGSATGQRTATIGDWELTVTGVAGRRITEVTIEPASPNPD